MQKAAYGDSERSLSEAPQSVTPNPQSAIQVRRPSEPSRPQSLHSAFLRRHGLFIALLLGATLLRLFQTTRLMVTTADIFRNLLHGGLVDRYGFAAAARPLESVHGLEWVCWPHVPYIYPVVSLLFFCAVAAAWPTVFFAKLVLTLIEAANAVLVWRATANRWLAALYWASPVSIWWVSREAQFEPVQNLFVLGALCLLPRLAPLAFLLLALAIQTKLTAVLLVPFFLISVAKSERQRLFPCLVALLLGAVPSVAAQLSFHNLNAIAGNMANLNFNPYYWNPFDKPMRDWVTLPLALYNQALTWPLLALLGWRVARSPRRWEYLAPLLFLLALKFHNNVQPWYFVLWPTFILPISDTRLRRRLLLLTPLLDITSTLSLFAIHFGDPNPTYYELIGVFKRLIHF